MRTYPIVFALLTALAAVPAVHAQGDVEAARSSLADAGPIRVDATVEGPAGLTSQAPLRIDDVVGTAVQRLQSANITIGARSEASPSLHIHLNMMQLDNGLVAFSVEGDFYQQVALTRNRREMRAVTWNESAVGLVSYDMTTAIVESIRQLVDQFARDFNAVN